MGAPSSRLPKKRAAATAQPTPCLYLGCFFFDEPGEPEYTGTFQIVVEAKDPEDAVRLLRKSLKSTREAGSLFTIPTTIYVEGIIKLAGSFEKGLLVNWESRPRPEKDDYQLTNLIPHGEGHQAAGYDFRHGDENTIQAFIDFGGKARAREIAAAKTAGTRIGRPRRSPEEIAKAREESAARKKVRVADAESAKQRRIAERGAKEARRRAIGETLAELNSAGPSRRGPP